MLEVKNLRAGVDGSEIIKGISLSVKAGEVHAIMGPNGSGKSTLAKVVAGDPTYEVMGGEVIFNGENLLELEPEQRALKGIFMGFQYPVEIPGVNNAEFLRMAYNARQVYEGKEEIDPLDFDDILTEKMEMLSMEKKYRERCLNDGFSGGEKKKNEILQMAILQPKLAVLDETDSGLDIDALRVVADGVNKLRNENNALILITHYQRLLEGELEAAKKLAQSMGVEHLILRTHEMDSPAYRANSINRCYHCKSELYSKLSSLAAERNFTHIVNGINQDDLGDHRPGIVAASEFGVVSPLAQAGFDKNDIRKLAQQIGLATWDKPANPCLSSRIPYGETVSPEKLSMIERAEDVLFSLGFTELRVRHHGDIARIELKKSDIPRIFAESVSTTIQKQFKQIGFKYATLDLEGFRSGRLNEGLIKNYI